MKLIRLKLNDKFRSLQVGFEVNFLRQLDFYKAEEFNPYVLAGLNGSGKSNILEVLAAIFYHIDCIYLDTKPESFEVDDDDGNPIGFDAKQSLPGAYELEYFIQVPEINNSMRSAGLAHISIIKLSAKQPSVRWLNRADFDEFDGDAVELSRVEVKNFLPTYILGYSSGENEILSLPFFKMRFINYDEYFERFSKKLDYEGRPEGRLVYLDNAYSQAILLANYLVTKPDDVASTLNPLIEELGITDVVKFRIIIKNNIKLEVEKGSSLDLT
jgi:restriction system-associated AAA family ATPase